MVLVTWNQHVPSREELFESKRLALLTEAVSAFNARGFHATSMSDLGRRLGVTKSALYYYFPSKQAILKAALDHVISIAFDSLEEACNRDIYSIDKLELTLRGYVEAVLSEFSRCVILTEEHALSEEERSAIVESRDSFEHALRDLVQEGIEDGSIIPCDPKLAIFSIFGAINWMPKWYHLGGEWTATQVAGAVSELICRSIRAKPQTQFKNQDWLGMG
jgi:TetR/AcrR family transcriptional regulator